MKSSMDFWSRGQYEEAVKVLKKSSAKTPVVLRHAMRLIGRGSNRDEIGGNDSSRDELIREELARVASNLMHSQRRQLRTLEVIGMVSPLLGLMGTVVGLSLIHI